MALCIHVFQVTQTPRWLDGTPLTYPLLYNAANNLGPSVNLVMMTLEWKFLSQSYMYAHTNKTVCLFLIISQFVEFFVMSVDCDKTYFNSFACQNNISTVLNAITVKDALCALGQFHCRDGSCILDIYTCDGKQDCSENEDEEQDQCYGKLDLYFDCGQGQFVPLSFICDGEKQCNNGKDERNCLIENQDEYKVDTLPEKHLWCNISQRSINGTILHAKAVPNMLKSDLMVDCPLGDDEVELFGMAEAQLKPFSENLCSDDNSMSCLVGHSTCYHKSQACIFDLNKYGRISVCFNGAHLVNCDMHKCTDMFKCPQSYCIPWRRICDDSFDCQDRSDEYNCKSFVCKGMLKCHNSSLCIHQSEQCDGIPHCPNHDDEVHCDLPACPTDCACLAKSISCDSMGLLSNPVAGSPTLRFLILNNNSISHVHNSEFVYMKLYLLDLSYNSISALGHSLTNLRTLHTLNLTGNNIASLRYNWFEGLDALKELEVANNELENVNELFQSVGSNSLINLSLINIASNMIEDIRGSEKVMQIGVLYLTGNPLQFLSFSETTKITIVYVDRELLCCYMNASRCICELDDLFTCTDTIIQIATLITLICGVVPAILLNVATIFWLVYKLKDKVSAARKSENIFKIHINIANLVYHLYIVLLASREVAYGDKETTLQFFLSDFANIPALVMMKSTVIIFMTVSPILCFQQIVHRCRVLKSMVISHSQKWVHVQVMLAWLFSVFAACVTVGFSSNGIIDIGQSFLGFPFLHSVNKTALDSAILISVVVYQLVLFIAMFIAYLKIIHIVHKSTKTMLSQSTISNRLRKVVMRVVIQASLKMLSWLPFLMLLLQHFDAIKIPRNIMTGLILWALLVHTVIQAVVTLIF